MVKMLMRHDICLSGLLGIYLNLRRLVVFLDIYSLIGVRFRLDLIIPLFDIACVILFTMILIGAHIMHVMLHLTLHHLGTILMLS